MSTPTFNPALAEMARYFQHREAGRYVARSGPERTDRMSTPTFNPALAEMARGEGVEHGSEEHLSAIEQIVANAVGHGHMAGMYRPAALALLEVFGPLLLQWAKSRLAPPEAQPPVPATPPPPSAPQNPPEIKATSEPGAV